MGLSFWLMTCLAGCIGLLTPVWSRGAGRAFPIQSENEVIENFQQINPQINWDETNYLVDLSGYYANCDVLKQPRGVITVDRKVQAGSSIVGVVDTIEGPEAHSGAVAKYITEIIKRWNSAGLYNNEIKKSSKFGCSVRPGCSGFAVVACLFGAEQAPDNIVKTTPRPAPTLPPTTRAPVTTTTESRPAPFSTRRQVRPTRPLFTGDVRALAFTKEQYKVAEDIFGRSWDPSHYLENLSGYETDCAMIGQLDWNFDHTSRFNELGSTMIKGLYGFAMNRGSTPNALVEILPKFKQTIHESNLKDLGCSLIPDCMEGSSMYVVISCLYEV